MANTQTFTGDGTTTAFIFNFSFFGVNDIHASINNIEVNSANFTVTPNASPDDADIQYTGGTVTFTTAPASGTTIKIWRAVELTRHIDYQPTLQPQSYQLNQDLNQCMEILKEQSETLINTLGLATIPNVAELLTELSAIRARLDTFLTDDDLTPLNTTVSGHTLSINTLNGYDYVVQSQTPTAENNYTWYRKYKSGWIEQGGISTDSDITFPLEFSNTNYTVSCTPVMINSSVGTISTCYGSKTVSSIAVQIRWNGSGTSGERCWVAYGY